MKPLYRNLLWVGILIGGVVVSKYAHELILMAIYFTKEYFYWPLLATFKKTIFTPQFYLFLGAILLIERLFPANKNQKILSTSFFQDIIWFFVESIGQAFIISTYVAFLFNFYHQHLSFLTIQSTAQIPEWGRLIIGIVLLDFLYWLQHFINHKVQWLWFFHSIHHSQKEVNVFTDFRYHTLEYVMRNTIISIPFYILGIKLPTLIYFIVFQMWFTRFYHGNIKTNLGWLRYILVTPQSHRVHHSIERRHQDKNFGSILSIWDFIFGTQYRGYDEYPVTGIEDEHFPHETSKNIVNLIRTPLLQLIYPFRRIAKQVFKSKE